MNLPLFTWRPARTRIHPRLLLTNLKMECRETVTPFVYTKHKSTQMRPFHLTCTLTLTFALAASMAGADFEHPGGEVGVLLGGIQENVLGESPVIGGGRVSVHIFRLIDAEAEVSRYPLGGATSLFPATQGLFGVRAGRRFGGLGIYAKLRPGFMRFDPNLYVPNLGTRPALDAGGIIEFYSRRHLAARIDFGDTVVWYGSDIVIPPISGIGGNVIARTRHQFQWGLGISVWF